MKKLSLIALAGIASLGMLSSCSDSSSNSTPSRSEACAQGLNEDCLVGIWKLNGLYDNGTISASYNYTADPATLEFKKDGSITFTYGTLSEAVSECKAGTIGGSWSIAADSSLTIKTFANNTCLASASTSIKPAIAVSETDIQMNIGKIFFLNATAANISDDEKARFTEIYTIGINE